MVFEIMELYLVGFSFAVLRYLLLFIQADLSLNKL
jgi:hypothetical protein